MTHFKPPEKTLILEGDNVRLNIVDEPENARWSVDWRVVLSNAGIRKRREWIGGRRLFTPEQLRCAFDANGAGSLARMSGADISCPEFFIRRGPYLNIPGPNVGVASKLALSIEVTGEMREAVRQLLA
ncbi:hypothetical protein A3D66_02420 [Candidatus Kaiserbacteria bacterium RIFCSPHIGHO2_02_FULL_50_9]|uniref:Uncharacterized protein n=1 Tax=Candidatus Kaiserbacteria bacterium RIFCSPLOWO2_01_FULL_51_21 TaxID=1798508 RepID=A0A1F6EE59_9BACT|nr:MAG: hypothetical protein A3D66_02420 [Candidatus Kaiserbacteria bacterium RIFCSPHIGHO2_02_FULL_50_9]OGG71492.1 MAG: hypothetical protein A3A35_01825 [Candidatus Kaiserbacteria bacterium RIFCSPLOWO2_01_FULL_51_21]